MDADLETTNTNTDEDDLLLFAGVGHGLANRIVHIKHNHPEVTHLDLRNVQLDVDAGLAWDTSSAKVNT